MDKWTIIIFGVTGDLSKRKLIPALFAMLQKHADKIGLIIGTGRDPSDPQEVLNAAHPFLEAHEPEAYQFFLEHFQYHQLDFNNAHDFATLEQTVRDHKSKHGAATHRLAYCATSSEYFCTITNHLVNTGLIVPHDKAHRVVYEKPFGHDLESAKHINSCIQRVLSETQVYRIDHYLAKEFVNNIVLLRYTNTLFKPMWNNTAIAAVKIIFHENMGIKHRGSFYDAYGALKDVVQNHILQLLALVAMDAPTALDPESFRDQKARLLQSVRVVDGILGQYDGYLKEPGVRENSRTETYAALKLMIDSPHWQGVPFYLETGKELACKTTEIQLILKPIPYCLWSPDSICSSNMITIHITPEEGFALRLNTKKPGTVHDITTVDFNFSYKSIFGPTSAEAYELLLDDILKGHQSIVVRFDEIEYQWNIIDQVYRMNLPLYTYSKGSVRPQEASQLMQETSL